MELTDRPAGPADSCIVAEIPQGKLGSAYRQARADLRRLVADWRRSKGGVLAKPLEVQLVGAAVFDGHHRAGGAGGRPGGTIGAKRGRCDAALRAPLGSPPGLLAEPPRTPLSR